MSSIRGSRSGHFAIVASTTMALALTSSVAPAAGLLARLSLETLQTRSDVVAIGTVVSSQSAFLGGTIQTSTTLAVQQSFKGAGGATLTILTPGGTYGNVELIVRGTPSFTVGEEVLVFLYAERDGIASHGHVPRAFGGFLPALNPGYTGPRIRPASVRRHPPACGSLGRAPRPVRLWLISSPAPYAVAGEPRGIPELLGSLMEGGQ